MNPADDRTRLLFGPYTAPPCALGDILVCQCYGRLRVTELSRGPIPWPACLITGKRPRLILCGDLVRALRRESAAAVGYWWGVCPTIVWRWRQALGVPQWNQGTRRLFAELLRTPLRQGKLQSPRTDLWTPEEDALISTAPDAEVAAQLGRSAEAVGKRRRRLGIPWFVRFRINNQEPNP